MDIRNKLQARLKLTSSRAQLNVLEIERDITAFFYIIHSGRIKWYLKDLYGFDGEKAAQSAGPLKWWLMLKAGKWSRG